MLTDGTATIGGIEARWTTSFSTGSATPRSPDACCRSTAPRSTPSGRPTPMTPRRPARRRSSDRYCGRRSSAPRSNVLRARPFGGPGRRAREGPIGARAPGERGDRRCGPAADRPGPRRGDGRRVPALDVPELVLRRGRRHPDRQRRDFRNARGEDVPLSVHDVVDRLAVDSRRARGLVPFGATEGHPFKVTFPGRVAVRAPVHLQARRHRRRLRNACEEFVDHAIEIERELVADAVAAGARYVQFDFPLYPYLVDPVWIERFAAQGSDLGDAGRRARSRPTPRCWKASRMT